MPIEIRELVIRARVDPGKPHSPGSAAAAGLGAARPPRQEDLVQACVREVLRILEEKRER